MPAPSQNWFILLNIAKYLVILEYLVIWWVFFEAFEESPLYRGVLSLLYRKQWENNENESESD